MPPPDLAFGRGQLLTHNPGWEGWGLRPDVICLRRRIRLVRLCVVVAWCTRALKSCFFTIYTHHTISPSAVPTAASYLPSISGVGALPELILASEERLVGLWRKI